MSQGGVFRWTGSTSSAFDTATNWYDVTTGANSAVVPGASDEALVTASGSITGDGQVSTLSLTGTAGGLSVTGTLLSDDSFLGGTVIVASHASLVARDLIDIGDETGGSPAGQQSPVDVTVDGGGVLEAQASSYASEGIIIGRGLDGANDALVPGNGTLTAVTQGGLGGTILSYGYGLTAALTVGLGGGSGQVDVTGSGSALGAFGEVWVGVGGSGTIAVSDAGRIVAGLDQGSDGTTIGAFTGMGALSLAGGSQGFFQGETVVGSGSLSVTGGSGLFAQSTLGTALAIGSDALSAGIPIESSVIVSDPYSFMDVSGGLDVGDGGNGTLTIENSARVVSEGSLSPATPVISIGSDGDGTVAVSSQAELVALGAGIAVGEVDAGILDVTSGTVTVTTAPSIGVSALDVGVAAGSQGVVDVSGGLILDTEAAGMIVGDSGSGTMAIGEAAGQGGLVLTGDPTAAAGVSIGVASGADGTVSISGSASGLGVYGAVADGVSGDGSLAVTDGGHLIATAMASLGTYANGLVLGVSAGSGVMSVDGGGQVYVQGQSVIGDSGTGALSITGGSSFTGVGIVDTTTFSDADGVAMVLGSSITGTGSVLISDPSTYVPLTGALMVGELGRGSLGVTSGAILSVPGAMAFDLPAIVVGGATGSTGTLSVSGQAHVLSGGAVDVGGGGNGELDVSDGTLTIDNRQPGGGALTIAGVNEAGTGVVNVAGGLIDDVTGAGVSATGTLNITQGGTVLTGGETGPGLSVGAYPNDSRYPGNPGLVSVSGSMSGLGVFGETDVTYGSLALSSGGRLVTGASALAVGLRIGGFGSTLVTLSGAAQAFVLGQTDVGIDGESGTETLSITGGSGFTGQVAPGTTSPYAVVVGGDGAFYVSDPSTYVSLTGGLYVGGEGSAIMGVSLGAVVSVTAVNATTDGVSLGSDSDTFVVDGTGSLLADVGVFELGQSSMIISAGGRMTVGEMAGQTGAAAYIRNGIIEVTGAGSSWAITGGLDVDCEVGTATVDISNGGSVTASSVEITRSFEGSGGTIVVSGEGSTLSTGTLTVDQATDNEVPGTLDVQSGGLVTASDSIALDSSTALAGGTMSAANSLVVAAGCTLSGFGTITSAVINNQGTIGVSSAGTMYCLGAIASAGTIAISGGGEISVSGVLGAQQAIAFGVGGGTLAIGVVGDIDGGLAGWATGDIIDLAHTAAVSDSYANGTLSLLGAESQTLGTLVFSGSFTASNFTLAALPGGGTQIGYHS